jgi:hypothetical protein
MSNTKLETPVSPEELAIFVKSLSAKINDQDHIAFPTCPANWRILEVTLGTKYARLVARGEVSNTSRSAYGFIDLSNGDILKADGWKKPARRARGNIRVGNVENGWNYAIRAYGVTIL